MTSAIDKTITDSINAYIMQRYANNDGRIAISDIIKRVKKSFDVDITDETISDIVSNNKCVASLDTGYIVLGTPNTVNNEQDKEDVNAQVHDVALDQIADHTANESVIDILTKCKVGDTIKSSRVKLNESDEHYHLYYGSKKANKNYIICEIMPKKNINESYFRCKIEGTALYIDIPVKSFLK